MKRLLSTLLSAVLLCSCAGTHQGDIVPVGTDTLLFAKGLTIRHFEGHTDVEVRNPWDTLRLLQRYILVEKDKALPKSLPEGVVIRIPVERAAVYTSVHAALMEQLGLIDRIAGVCEPEYITSSLVRSLVDDGSIADLGSSSSPNIEKIMDIGTDIIIASPFENAGYGSAEKLGIPIIEAADYMESHPLGRAEWVRFYGLLFGCGQRADSVFTATMQRYNALKELSADVPERPTVLLEKRYGSSWFIPSGDSYIGVLHRDAGADYLFADYTGRGNTPLSYESVFDIAQGADYWFFKYDSSKDYTLRKLREEYPPYANFKAFAQASIYGCNTIACTYFDDITLHPDLVLADLIHIYHPSLLPDHVNRYYFRLEP